MITSKLLTRDIQHHEERFEIHMRCYRDALRNAGWLVTDANVVLHRSIAAEHAAILNRLYILRTKEREDAANNAGRSTES